MKFLTFLCSFGLVKLPTKAEQQQGLSRPGARKRTESPPPTDEETAGEDVEKAMKKIERNKLLERVNKDPDHIFHLAADPSQEFCETMRNLGLSLLNICLESGGEEMCQSDIVVIVIQEEVHFFFC